jgi:hypothetical protein
MAIADKFVASRQEFRIVALAPVVLISAALLLLLVFVPPLWSLTILGVLFTHTRLAVRVILDCSVILTFTFDFHKDKIIVTCDDKAEGMSYFYEKVPSVIIRTAILTLRRRIQTVRRCFYTFD